MPLKLMRIMLLLMRLVLVWPAMRDEVAAGACIMSVI